MPSAEARARSLVAEYISDAVERPPAEMPLTVAAVLRFGLQKQSITATGALVSVTRPTLIKYGLTRDIRAAAAHQARNWKAGGGSKVDEYQNKLRGKQQELIQAQEHARHLIGRLQLVEFNAHRMGWVVDELWKQMPRAPRHVPRTGKRRSKS